MTFGARIEDVGRDSSRGGSRSGYRRHLFDDAELDLRAWFIERATAAGLAVETDRNTNIWAWWGAPGPEALVGTTGNDVLNGQGGDTLQGGPGDDTYYINSDGNQVIEKPGQGIDSVTTFMSYVLPD